MLVSAPPPLLALAERLTARVPLARAERESLLDLPAANARLASHRQIASNGELNGHAYLVVEGLIGRVQQASRGEQQITSVYLPGEIACLEAMIRRADDPPIHALVPTSVLVIPQEALDRAARRHPEIARALWSECQFQARIGTEWLINIGRRRSLSRTAHLFCELAWRHGSPGRAPRTRFPLAARQSQLADMLALTPVHLNRVLKTLRVEGLASFEDRDLCIHDWPRLASLGGFDPAYLL